MVRGRINRRVSNENLEIGLRSRGRHGDCRAFGRLQRRTGVLAGVCAVQRDGFASRHDHLVTYTSVRAPKVKPDHHKSWVSPDVKRAPRLLFISDDSTQDVYIFTMPAMQLKGTLTGFNGPQGMCTDRQGNIWIVNTGTAQGLKYSRTGKQLSSVSDPSGTPVGCAVNPTNGDLALSDILGSSGAGGIEIYPTPREARPDIATRHSTSTSSRRTTPPVIFMSTG